MSACESMLHLDVNAKDETLATTKKLKIVNQRLNNTDELKRIFPPSPAFRGTSIIPYPADDERSKASRLFQGEQWTDMSLERIARQYPGPVSELPAIMTDGAYAYFFPFLIACILEVPGKCDSLSEAMLHRVVRDAERGGGLLSLFNNTQRQYIACFFIEQFGEVRGYQEELRAACLHLKNRC
jgi:hypothetical protein